MNMNTAVADPTLSERQLPVLEGYTKTFYGFCRQHELRFQRCAKCKAWRHPPRPMCNQCNSCETEWVKVQGKGTVHCWTVPMAPIGRAFASDLPYAAAVVELCGVPDDEAGLLALPGVGRYAANATLAVGFGRRAPVVDDVTGEANGAPILIRGTYDLSGAATPTLSFTAVSVPIQVVADGPRAFRQTLVHQAQISARIQADLEDQLRELRIRQRRKTRDLRRARIRLRRGQFV